LGTVSTIIARVLIEILQRSGVPSEQAQSAFASEASVLADPEARVPAARIIEFFAVVEELTGDPFFGLHAAEMLGKGDLRLLELTVSAAPNLRGALERVARYYGLIHERTDLTLTVEGDLAVFAHRKEGFPKPLPRHEPEMLLAAIVIHARRLTGVALPLRAVHFAHPRPPDISEHERVFGKALVFGASVDALLLDAADLERPLLTADPALREVLERYAALEVSKLAVPDRFLTDVRECVARSLSGGEPTLESTAAAMKISTRTLQRRLQEFATSHQEVIDDVRKQLALGQLAREGMAISEVAYLLGFSDVSTFHRAFKRWTGSTPGEFRKQLVL
jgi:AraC-like DNA-binding protein